MQGYARARRRPDRLPGVRPGEPAHRGADADLADRRLAALEGPGAVPVPAFPGGHLRRAGQRPLGPSATTRRPTATTPRSASCSRCWTRPAPSTPCWPACAWAPGARWSPRPATRTGSTGGGDRAGRAAPDAAAPGTRRASASTASWTPTQGWAKYNREFWRRDYPAFVRFFFEHGDQRAALHEAARGRDRLGAADHAGEAMIASEEAPRCVAGPGRDRAAAACGAVPGPGDPRFGRPLPAGRADGRGGRADRRARRASWTAPVTCRTPAGRSR